MGGDLGPSAVIDGLSKEKEKNPNWNTKYIFFGDKKQIQTLLNKKKHLLNISDIVHSDQVISNETKPTDALRKFKKSSMFMAVEAVKKGKASAVVSGGNTGALMVISTVLLKTINGINRPAIASMFPTKYKTREFEFTGKIKKESRIKNTVMLDLGANIECNEKNILDFALMGKVFANTVLGVTNPKIGLLNVGSEILKGNKIVQLAAEKLNKERNINFYGFIEGNDIPMGIVDVVVTDGFTGNIALKTAEGTAELYSSFLKDAFKKNIYSKFASLLSLPVIKTLKNIVNPANYNGAMLLGLNGIVVKSHGRSDANGISNAIFVANIMSRENINKKMISDINKFLNKK